MEKINIVEWLNKTIASLQSNLQHGQDDLSIPDFIYPPEVGQLPNKFSEDYLQKQRNARIKSIDAAFDKFPQLEIICKDWRNNVLDSCFNKFIFVESRFNTGEFDIRENYFMNFVNLAGHNLTRLNVEKYPYSRMMQFIKINCPNLELLYLTFKEINSGDFENVFSNMSHLKLLSISWECEDSIFPETLVKSLEQVGGTLESFYLEGHSKDLLTYLPQIRKNFCALPCSLASVFPRLIALKAFDIIHWQIVQPLFQSIGEIKNLKKLLLKCELLNTFEYVCPFGLFKNLREFYIYNDESLTDEFLIYLCNNAEKLERLGIGCANITDNGIIALNNLKQLKWLNLNSYRAFKIIKMEFITDKSIQYLFIENLESLCLSNIIKITNRSVIKLLKNLPNLDTLYILHTKTTYDVVEEISKLTKYRNKELKIYVSFEDRDLSFPMLKKSHNIIISNSL